jgi:hypothetical protein
MIATFSINKTFDVYGFDFRERRVTGLWIELDVPAAFANRSICYRACRSTPDSRTSVDDLRISA